MVFRWTKKQTDNNNSAAVEESFLSDDDDFRDEFTRTPSVAYREGTTEAIERVLEEVERQGEKRIRDGFSEFNFTVGILNCFFCLFVFNVFPQHFWLLYVIEGMYLFPAKIHYLMQAKPLNQLYYFLDYCWVMNAAGLLGLVLCFMGKSFISDSFRKHLYLGAYGTAIGPLTCATAVLPFVSLLFHHRDTMTGFFIHFFPPLLFYVFRWQRDIIKEAWPNTFDLDYDVVFWPGTNGASFTETVFGNGILFYLAWFIPYFLWQLFIGLDLPRLQRRKTLADGITPAPTEYDTVFHSNMRGYLCVYCGKMFWNRPKDVSLEQIKTNDFEMRDFLVYMATHFSGCILSFILFGYPCYVSKYMHGIILWILFAICAYRGAKRYTYYSTKMYSKIIRKQFAREINPEHLPSVAAVTEKGRSQTDATEISPMKSDANGNTYKSLP